MCVDSTGGAGAATHAGLLHGDGPQALSTPAPYHCCTVSAHVIGWSHLIQYFSVHINYHVISGVTIVLTFGSNLMKFLYRHVYYAQWAIPP